MNSNFPDLITESKKLMSDLRADFAGSGGMIGFNVYKDMIDDLLKILLKRQAINDSKKIIERDLELELANWLYFYQLNYCYLPVGVKDPKAVLN